MATKNIEDLDVYEILKLPGDCTTQDIKKAYRKAALECHPDKCPDDANAAAKFIQLGAILKLLLEPHSRKAYDALRKARLQNKIRLEKQDSVRKKFREDLERRERESSSAKADTRSAEEKLKAEIERLRKESSKLLEEEIAAMQRMVEEDLRKERESASDEKGYRLKLKWKRSLGNYDANTLTDIFSKHGHVSGVVTSQKGSALLELDELVSPPEDIEKEGGLASNPITITWLLRRPKSRSKPEERLQSHPPAQNLSADFEELVFSRLQEAQRLQESQP